MAIGLPYPGVVQMERNFVHIGDGLEGDATALAAARHIRANLKRITFVVKFHRACIIDRHFTENMGLWAPGFNDRHPALCRAAKDHSTRRSEPLCCLFVYTRFVDRRPIPNPTLSQES